MEHEDLYAWKVLTFGAMGEPLGYIDPKTKKLVWLDTLSDAAQSIIKMVAQSVPMWDINTKRMVKLS